MGFYGLAIYGPSCSLWYNKWLPKLVPMDEKNPSKKALGLKILYDEIVQGSFFYLTLLYTLTRFSGGTHDQGVEKVNKDFLRCYLADLAVWPWV